MSGHTVKRRRYKIGKEYANDFEGTADARVNAEDVFDLTNGHMDGCASCESSEHRLIEIHSHKAEPQKTSEYLQHILK